MCSQMCGQTIEGSFGGEGMEQWDARTTRERNTLNGSKYSHIQIARQKRQGIHVCGR